MPTLSSITAHLVIPSSESHYPGTALTEYSYPAHGNQEPGTITTYTELVPNTVFCIYIDVPQSYTFPGDVIVWRVFIDKAFSSEAYTRPKQTNSFTIPEITCDTGSKTNLSGPVRGFLNGATGQNGTRADWRFPHAVIDSNLNYEAEDIEAWEKHEIVLQVAHGRFKCPLSATELAAMPTSGDSSSIGDITILDEEEVLAFVFLPRPLAVLEEILDLPGFDSGSISSHNPNKIRRLLPTPPANDEAYVNTLRNVASRNRELYCICKEMKRDQVVTCDNDLCEVKSFHLRCIGLRSQPKGNLWLCLDCRSLPKKELKLEGRTQFFGPSDPNRAVRKPRCACKA